ncbi:MAG: methyltransferase domain-containing protein [Planctomycetes bacterium]|nr:methyltransferase domain-containing protein [Planctomycetota bacterium]
MKKRTRREPGSRARRLGPPAGAAGPARPDPRSAVRRTALEILTTAPDAGRFVDEALAARLGELEGRDRHLLQEIVYGTVRHRNTLDHVLDFYLRVPMTRQRPAPRWALRLGAYQLIYLDRIPAHAAVNQTLHGLKALPGTTQNEVGFTNAVLHKIAADVRKKARDEPLDRDDPTVVPIRSGFAHFTRPVLPLYRLDPVSHLSVKHSHPRWLVERWLERHGEEEARRLLEAQNRVPQVTARVTRLGPSREAVIEALRSEGLEAAPGSLEDSIVFRQAGGLERSAVLERGWIQVQDETAIEIGRVLAPPEGARVLDLCAAPGGKALQLLESVGPAGHVVAADRSEERLALVRQNLSRAGSNFTALLVPEDAGAVQLGETFTHVLLDAPCSNTGVLARRPEARWRLRPDDLRTLVELQSKLLEAALRHLAPGGRLVYATCSIEPEENEEVVAAAFARHPDLIERETRLFLPHRTPGDGGFYSLLLRSRA